MKAGDDHGFAPVYRLSRGGLSESLHFGAAAAVDSAGRLIAWIGDAHLVTFMRSTAKPLQALPFVEAGGPERFDLTPREVALLCASHTGSDDHADTAASIQRKAGIRESDLQCGTHLPSDPQARARLQAEGADPTPNRHNCSGKHSGMLAYACLHGWPLNTYLDPDHHLQRRILTAVSEMSGLDAGNIGVGIDGCSAPNFALPLYNAALAFARLVDPQDLPARRAEACGTITSAMTGNPEMVAGAGQFDTALMVAGRGAIIAKGGAEGYQGIGLVSGSHEVSGRGLGIAVKISDGAERRSVRSAVALAVLSRLGALTADQCEELAAFGPTMEIENYRGLKTGAGEPWFELKRSA